MRDKVSMATHAYVRIWKSFDFQWLQNVYQARRTYVPCMSLVAPVLARSAH